MTTMYWENCEECGVQLLLNFEEMDGQEKILCEKCKEKC